MMIANRACPRTVPGMTNTDLSLPRVLTAVVGPTVGDVRRAVRSAPAGVFIHPRHLGGHPHAAQVMRDLRVQGEVLHVAHTLYYKPSGPSDVPSTADVAAAVAGRVRYVDLDGAEAVHPDASPDHRHDLLTEAYLKRAYVEELRSANDVGAELGVTGETVLRAVRRLGLGVRRRGPQRPNTAGLTEAWLRQAYVVEGRSLSDMAAELGCCTRTISRTVALLGIEARRGRIEKLLTAEVLRKLYVEEGLSTVAVGERLGCSGSSVANALSVHGIKTRTSAERSDCGTVLTKAFLEAEWMVKGRSLTDIATEVGCGRHAVRDWLDRHGFGATPTDPRTSPDEIPS